MVNYRIVQAGHLRETPRRRSGDHSSIAERDEGAELPPEQFDPHRRYPIVPSRTSARLPHGDAVSRDGTQGRGPRADEAMVVRLLAGLEESIRERGYPATTVADVVSAAGTSKRAFYQNFATKGDCLLEHYRRFHAAVVADIAAEAPLAASSSEATVVGVEIYFRAFVTKPHIARAHLLDVLTIEPDGARARSDISWSYVRGMQQVMGTAREDRPAMVLDDARGLGILGGINEIALDVVARGDASKVEPAVQQAVAFVRSIIRDLPTVEDAR